MILGYFAIIFGAIALGFTGIIYKATGMSPASACFWRMVFALPFCYVWMRFEKQESHNNLPLTALAALLFTLDVVLYQGAFNFTSVAKATLLSALATLYVVIFAAFLGEKLTRTTFFALTLALIGAYFVISAKGLGSGETKGDAMAAVSALFFAGYILVARIVRGKMNAGAFNFYTVLFCIPISLIIALLFEDSIWPQTREAWFYLFLLGSVAQALGQGITAYALGKIPAGVASIAMSLNAPVAAFASAWLLAEYPLPMQIFGGGLIIVALILVRPR